jgi:hypothetical protein
MNKREDFQRLLSVAIQQAKEKTDIGQVIQSYLGPPKVRSGRWLKWSCPKHGNDTDPSFAVTPDNGTFTCFGCGFTGDVIEFMKFQHPGMTIWQIVKQLLGTDSIADLRKNGRVVAPVSPETPTIEQKLAAVIPPDVWQDQAWEFIHRSQQALWGTDGAEALAYLKEWRGLTDTSIRMFRLGYNPQPEYHPLTEWGLESDADQTRLYLPAGIVIPCILNGSIRYITIRRQQNGNKSINKYHRVRGSKTALFGADFLAGAKVALFLEGELDTITAWQEAQTHVERKELGVATLGSGVVRLDLDIWGAYLANVLKGSGSIAPTILLAYDQDGKSNVGIANMLQLSPYMRAVPVPKVNLGDKDVNDAHVSSGGTRIGLWISDLLNMQKQLKAIHSEIFDHQVANTMSQLLTTGEAGILEELDLMAYSDIWKTVFEMVIDMTDFSVEPADAYARALVTVPEAEKFWAATTLTPWPYREKTQSELIDAFARASEIAKQRRKQRLYAAYQQLMHCVMEWSQVQAS